MTCDSFEPLLALRAEGDLPADATDAVEVHLAACLRCRAFAASLEDSQAAVRDLADEEIDPAALAAVRRRVHRGLDGRQRRAVTWWLAAAALAAVTIAALRLLSPAHRGPASASSVASRPTEEVASSTATPTAVAVATPADRVARGAPPAVQARALRREPAGEVAHESAPNLTDAVPAEAVVVKLETNDPNVVIYWLVDSNGGQS
jgi:anti-sigma factor RsiW